MSQLRDVMAQKSHNKATHNWILRGVLIKENQKNRQMAGTSGCHCGVLEQAADGGRPFPAVRVRSLARGSCPFLKSPVKSPFPRKLPVRHHKKSVGFGGRVGRCPTGGLQRCPDDLSRRSDEKLWHFCSSHFMEWDRPLRSCHWHHGEFLTGTPGSPWKPLEQESRALLPSPHI